MSRQLSANGRDRGQRPICGLARPPNRTRLRQADRPSQADAGRVARAVKGRRSWSPERRISTLIRLLRRAVAQGVQIRVRKSRPRRAAAAQRVAGSVFETCWGVSECKQVSCGLLVRASQIGASGPVRGIFSFRVQWVHTPDCTEPRLSTTLTNLCSAFVRSGADFAVNSRCDHTSGEERMAR